MKEYTSYQVCSYHALQLFPTKQLHFYSSPCFSIQYFNDSGTIYKNSNLPSNSLVKDIFHCNHIQGSQKFCISIFPEFLLFSSTFSLSPNEKSICFSLIIGRIFDKKNVIFGNVFNPNF